MRPETRFLDYADVQQGAVVFAKSLRWCPVPRGPLDSVTLQLVTQKNP